MQALHARLGSLSIVLLCGLGMLAGCGNESAKDDGDGGGNSISGPGKDARGPATWSPAREDCTNPAYPEPLAVTTTVEDERGYLVGVVACASQQQPRSVWLHNVGGDVWTLQGGGNKARWLDWSLESLVFRETFERPLLLLPDDVVVLNSLPDRVSWSVDKAFAVAWETQAEGLDRVRSYSREVWAAQLRRKETPARVALASCTTSAYQVADTSADPDGFQEELTAVLSGTTDAADCDLPWQRAWNRGLDPTVAFLDAVGSQYRVLNGFEPAPKITID